MAALPVKVVCLIWLVNFGALLQTVKSQGSTDTCYCLTKELGNLRNPVHIESAKLDNKQVHFIAEQIGVLSIYNGQKLEKYVDISDKVVCETKTSEERGLLGFALHPDFSENKKVYLYTIREIGGKEYAVISEIVDKDVAAETIILLIEQPGEKRNGGQLVFGDDGCLYIFVGDGGPASDDDIQAQNGMSLLGKILRIDVDNTAVVDNKLQPYTVPDDNPKHGDWLPEIYALGMRNSWRCFEDIGGVNGVGKGRIFCGELGSNIADEINLVKKGGNYGWNYKEGRECVSSNSTACSSIAGEELPVAEFRRDTSNITALVGGPVYRGSQFSSLIGQLLYGDFMSREMYRLKENTDSRWVSMDFPRCDDVMCECGDRNHEESSLLSIGVTHDNEVLLMVSKDLIPTAANGAMYRLKPPNKSGHVTCGTGSFSMAPVTVITSLLITFISMLSS